MARLEQEKEALQGQLDSQRREQRQREREVARLRQQLESTASALEHSNQRACSLEAEHRSGQRLAPPSTRDKHKQQQNRQQRNE